MELLLTSTLLEIYFQTAGFLFLFVHFAVIIAGCVLIYHYGIMKVMWRIFLNLKKKNSDYREWCLFRPNSYWISWMYQV